MNWTNKPKRLDQVYATYRFPVYFVTVVTARRRALLDRDVAHRSLIDYARENAGNGRVMGRYVLMPDHMHFMVRLSADARLADYVRLLRQRITIALRCAGAVKSDEPVWQPGFFDRLLRTAERHGAAWDYMLRNPLQAGLADVPDHWPYQGEIEAIRF